MPLVRGGTADCVRIVRIAVLKRQDAGIEDDSVADLDGAGNCRGHLPRFRALEYRFEVGQQCLADLPRR